MSGGFKAVKGSWSAGAYNKFKGLGVGNLELCCCIIRVCKTLQRFQSCDAATTMCPTRPFSCITCPSPMVPVVAFPNPVAVPSSTTRSLEQEFPKKPLCPKLEKSTPENFKDLGFGFQGGVSIGTHKRNPNSQRPPRSCARRL